jgi:RHS repeat-associated protein
VSTDYDFLSREYSTQGRWPSPDPAGLGATSPANPQSWNRYAYVMNDPLGFTDRLGLDPCTFEDGNTFTCWEYGEADSYSNSTTTMPSGGPIITTSVTVKDDNGNNDTLLWGCSPPTSGGKNQATGCGYQFAREQNALPAWYVKDVLPNWNCNTPTDCSNIPADFQSFTQYTRDPNGYITGASGGWTTIFQDMGITGFTNMPSSAQPISQPASQANCIAAANAITKYMRAHHGASPPEYLTYALSHCS